MGRVQYVRDADKRPPSLAGFLLFWLSANTVFTGLVAGITYIQF